MNKQELNQVGSVAIFDLFRRLCDCLHLDLYSEQVMQLNCWRRKWSIVAVQIKLQLESPNVERPGWFLKTKINLFKYLYIHNTI